MFVVTSRLGVNMIRISVHFLISTEMPSFVISMLVSCWCLGIRATLTPADTCDGSLLGAEDVPDSAFTATSNSEAMDQVPGSAADASSDHSAKTAR